MVEETAEKQFRNYLEKLIDNALEADLLPNDITDIMNAVVTNRENIRRNKLAKALGLLPEQPASMQQQAPKIVKQTPKLFKEEEPQETEQETIDETEETEETIEEEPNPNKPLTREEKIALLRAKKNFKG